MRFAVFTLLAAVSALLPTSGAAQSPADTERDPRVAALVARADSLVIGGDSSRAMAVLDSALRLDRRAAGAWHRKGRIAWRLAQPDSTTRVKWTERNISLIRQADSSLRYAAAYAPDSSRFHLTLANFFLSHSLVTVRFNAMGAFERAAEAAVKGGDSITASEAMDRVGMRYWRRYEPLIDRVAPGGVENPDFDVYIRDERLLQNFLENFAHKPESRLGDGDFSRARDHFEQALSLNANNVMARRHLFMTMTSRGQWTQLRDAAQGRLHRTPWDPWGWLALGLATHRLGDDGAATAAFDSALVLLGHDERTHFTRLSRLLGARDSARFAGMSEQRVARAARLYWAVADPLALTPGNEYWLEFLSRVTEAELLYSVEEYGIRGANTDRGAVLVRYGPPDLSMSFPPDTFGQIGILWRYRSGLAFAFRLSPSFGTASAAFDVRDVMEERFNRTPARWDNLATTRRMDSITTVVTLFRGAGDSVDVVIAAEIPAGRLARGVNLESGAMQIGFIAFDGDANLLARDTSSLAMDFDAADSAQVLHRSWRRRLGSGEIGFRVEALQPESGNAARSVAAVELSRGTGFGVSDVLLADSVGTTGGLPERWSDLSIAASTGRVRRGRDIALVWETYDLAADSTRSSAYRVEIGIVRTDGTRIGRAITRVLGGTLGRGEGRGRDDRVAVSFDRRVPARPVTLDYLTLDLGDLAAGAYRLTITVVDSVTNARAEGSRELMIVR
ncbi:MAG TPA: GWxTD domain-containing protein [Gemmatimonadaceae bacterium]|nr:GWxTD domain-containing protein [Gemmatimonadaceae bacterium]